MESQNNNEIDILELLKLVKRFFDWIGQKIYGVISFLLRNAVVIGATIVIGFLAGWGLDYLKGDTYLNQIIVTPNFGSVDYLYSKVENFEDQEFLKDKGDFEKITEVEVEPIFDLVTMNQSYGEGTKELINALIDNGSSLEDLKKDETIIKKNKYHIVNLFTKDPSISNKVVDDFVTFLNNNVFLKEKSEKELQNLLNRKKSYEESMVQIDSIIKEVNKDKSLTMKSDFSFNSYGDLNNLVKLKGITADKIAVLEVRLLELEKPILDIQRTINVKQSKFFSSFKFILPILLLLLLSMVAIYRYLGKKYK